jgi:hypothetical protein
MGRYTATEAIVLPRMTAVGAKTLGTQMISATKPYKKDKKLPKGVLKALQSLESKHEALSLVLRDLVKPDASSGLDPMKIDRVLDAGWSALHGFFETLIKLFWLPLATEAAELKRLIFDDGLKFIQLPYLLQWSESDTRLSRIKDNGLEPRIEALGGKLFLDEIKKAQADYGKALGVTAPKAGALEDAPAVRAALDAFGDALRNYVIKAMGIVEEDEPETKEISDALLAPLDAWDVGPMEKAAKPEPGQAEGTENA